VRENYSEKGKEGGGGIALNLFLLCHGIMKKRETWREKNGESLFRFSICCGKSLGNERGEEERTRKGNL